MTQSVVEKTSIPEKTCRRQTDSPTWWIAFSCGSVILHLLAFWLISLYRLSGSQSGSQEVVPIEFIEISPQKPPQAKPQPKPKPVLPKPSAKPIVPQNSQPTVNSSAVEPPVIRNDEDAIAFDQKIEQKLVEQQRQQELLQQKLAEQQRQQELLQQQKLAEQQRQLETEQRQREAQQQRQIAEQLRQRQAQQEQLEAQLRQKEQLQQRQWAEKLRQEELEQQRELEAQRQQAEQQRLLEAQQKEEAEKQRRLEAQRQQEQEQRQLANQRKLEAEQQRLLATEEQLKNPADGEKITTPILDKYGDSVKEASVNQQTPDSPVKDNRLEQIPLNQNQQTQLKKNGGILTASWKIETDTFFKDKPDNLAQPLKTTNRDIPLPSPQDGNFQPGEFLVWLTIDNQGNLLFIKVDEAIPVALRSQYQEYAQKIFNGQKFIPASGNNGTKPELSNLPVRVNIQSSSN